MDTPVKKKNPVGRPRKNKLPPGSVPENPKVAKAPTLALELAASGASVHVQKQPRGRPHKVRTESAPATELVPESSQEPSSSRHGTFRQDVGPGHKPKAGSFTHSVTEGHYNTQIFNPSSETEAEFDDNTDEDNADADDTDVNETRLGGTEKVLKRFRLDWKRERIRAFDEERTKSQRYWNWEMFPQVEDEDNLPAEDDRPEASHQRQTRMCEAYGCYTERCRINHMRRGNVASFLEGLDERVSQLNKPMDEEAAAALNDDSTAVEGVKQLADLMETEMGVESQFESLFSGIVQGREEDWT